MQSLNSFVLLQSTFEEGIGNFGLFRISWSFLLVPPTFLRETVSSAFDFIESMVPEW